MENNEFNANKVARENADVIKEITGLDINTDSKHNFNQQREFDTTERDNFLNWLVEKDSELSVSFDDKPARVVKWEYPSGLISNEINPKDTETKATPATTIYLNSFEEIEEVFKDFVMVGIFGLRESNTDELLRGNYMVRFGGILSEVWDMDNFSKEAITIAREYFKQFVYEENKDG